MSLPARVYDSSCTSQLTNEVDVIDVCSSQLNKELIHPCLLRPSNRSNHAKSGVLLSRRKHEEKSTRAKGQAG